MNLDDTSIIKKCIQQDPLAQKMLYDIHSKKLYGICLRYAQNEEEAQDILQDSFMKIYSKLDTFKFQGSFEGWLKHITTNTAIDYYRKKSDFIELDEIYHNPYLTVNEDKNLEVEELLGLIQEMPDGYRMVFNMYAIEGYSHAEIATKLNISEGTSKSQLSRAKLHLQKKIVDKNQVMRKAVQPLEQFFRLFR